MIYYDIHTTDTYDKAVLFNEYFSSVSYIQPSNTDLYETMDDVNTLSKAFDKVWHKGLLYKLRKAGISDQLLNWVKSYLTNRQQRVVINGTHSNTVSINGKVPQGSVVGPLFSLYI